MTVEEFVKEIQDDLSRFAEQWSSESAKDPDNWPPEMPAGEWFEQFIGWLDT